MPKPNQPTFDEIGEKIMVELNRRLGDEDTAEGLPGTLLMQLAQRYIAYLEKKQEIERQKMEEDGKKIPPLVMIDRPGLPMDRRIGIMSEYLDELEAEWRAASERFIELCKEAGVDPASVS